MREQIRSILAAICTAAEFILAVLVLIAIGIASITLVREMGFWDGSWLSPQNFDAFLGHALGLVVGLEFIKMLTRHTPGAVIEVLLFAIARQIIVYHTSFLDTLLGILSVAAVFAIRKFCFVETFDPHIGVSRKES